MKNTRASKTVALGATAAMVTAITGCSVSDSTETTETYAILCQNTETGERVPDEECENAGDAVDKVESFDGQETKTDETHTSSNSSFVFLPLWLNTGGSVPAVGERISGNDIRTTKPSTGHGYYMGEQGGNIKDNGRVVAKPGTNGSRTNSGTGKSGTNSTGSGNKGSGKSNSGTSRGGFGGKGGGATGSGSHGG